MSTKASLRLIIVTVTSALAACASNGPTVNPGNRYQLVGKIDGENYYCQKQARTGSRANSKVSCVNQEMFEAYSKVGQDPMVQGPRSGGSLFGGSQ